MNTTEHLLTCLIEECGEVIQAVCKIQRFAIDGYYPDGKSNIEVLEYELKDVLAIVQMLQERAIVKDLDDQHHFEAKKVKVLRMMEIARERGSLE